MARAAERGRKGTRPGAFLPLVLLVVVALFVGFLNVSLVEPYTSPRAAADDQGAYIFYDTAERSVSSERAFLLRRTADASHFEKPQRIEGTLLSSAVLSDEHLVSLFPDFLSVYARLRQLDREWSTAATSEALGFEAKHLARLRGKLYAFGTSPKDGALRAARLDPEANGDRPAWKLVPLESRIEKAAEPPGPEVAERGDDAPPTVPAPVAWASAEDKDGTLAVLFRVQRLRPRGGFKTGEVYPGVVRVVRFDGTAFVGSEAGALEDDLPAIAACSVETASVGSEVHVFGVKRESTDATIGDSVLDGSKLRPNGTIPYKKGGFFEDRPAVALAAFAQKGRVVLLAQVGGSVRVAVETGGHWGEWTDVAKMPAEALALVYVYMGALLVLGAVMIVAALWALKTRLARPRGGDLDEATADRMVAEALGGRAPAATEPAPAAEEDDEEGDPSENDAPIPDRFVAFLIDLAIVGGLLSVVRSSFQIDIGAKPGEDPTRALALLAWGTLALLAYFTIAEGFFGRTPGKRLVGLEVRTTDGREPSLLARLYRNLFRIELIFLVTVVQAPLVGDQRFPNPIPVIAIAIMLTTPRGQRPGDLIAGTVVQRSREPKLPAEEAAAPEEEEQKA